MTASMIALNKANYRDMIAGKAAFQSQGLRSQVQATSSVEIMIQQSICGVQFELAEHSLAADLEKCWAYSTRMQPNLACLVLFFQCTETLQMLIVPSSISLAYLSHTGDVQKIVGSPPHCLSHHFLST